MSSQKHREDKLHEIDDLLRRCHNEAVYHLLLDERKRIKRDVEKRSRDHERRRSHRHGDKRKSRSHSSFDDIPAHKKTEKGRTVQQKSATLDPRVNSRNMPPESEPKPKTSPKKEHRKVRAKSETVEEKPDKHVKSNGHTVTNSKTAKDPKKHKEHGKTKRATPETEQHKSTTLKSEKQPVEKKPENKKSELDIPPKLEKPRKPKSEKKTKTLGNGSKHNTDTTVKSTEPATQKVEKEPTNNHKTKTQQKSNKKTETEVKSIRPKELPVKEFTADEIAQMSKNHRSKQLPSFMQKDTEDKETEKTATVAKSPTTPQPKAATWNEVSPKYSVTKSQSVPKSENTDSAVQQPVIQTLRRGGELNVSSGSSNISSRLMKLKQSDRRPNWQTKRPTQSNGALDTIQRDGKIVNTQQVTPGKEPNEAKTKSLKSKTKVHKLLRWQHSSPAALEDEKQPQYLDIGNMSENERTVENHKVEQQREKNPEVVFRVDLDELNRRNSKTKGLSSFFRQRVMRTKSTERKQANTKECETQTHAWEIPALLLEQATQTANIEILSASTQTFNTGQVASTQTPHKKYRDVSIQFEPRCSTTETQTTSSGVPSETQTEDEDSPVWGNSNRLSLDRLVRTRGRRKVKMKRANSQDEISTGSQEFDESVLKRATTLPHGGAKEEKPTKQKITSFHWTQTDKFVKITISYSGAHLIPSNKIKVTTNGINFRLKINSDEVSNPNTSNSNNNNSSQDIIPAELYISRLRYFVSGLSYTVLPDMLTVLLRKQKVQNWDSLEFTGTKRTVIENV